MDSEATRDYFEEGKRFLKKDNLDKALRAFEKAFRDDKENPYHMSYYGMCKALRGGQIGLALELCTRAIKKDFTRAEFYLNLGRVYLAAGNKKSAMKVFKKGLRFDPENEQIARYLAELGFRKKPVITALDRSNPLNKLLGILLRRTIPRLTSKK